MNKTLNLANLGAVNSDRAGMAAVNALNGQENFSPAEQMAGLTLAFSAGMKRFGVTPSDAFRVAQNLWTRSRAEQSIRAVKKYIESEW